MDQLITELKHLGLSEKEAGVYLASLELGPAPVQDISHKAKVNRATTYVMIESLSSRGLMSTFIKGKKRYYAAENPDRLLSILRIQQKELEEKQGELAKTLPLLLALYNSEGAKPQIRYLEGIEGLKTVRETFEKLEGEFIQIFPLDEAMMDKFEGDHAKHVKNLRNDQTPHRVIAVTDNPVANETHDLGVGEWRYISTKEFPIHGEITVRGDHIFLFSYRSAVLAVIVTSKEIADTVRALFNLAWKGAEGSPSQKFGK